MKNKIIFIGIALSLVVVLALVYNADKLDPREIRDNISELMSGNKKFNDNDKAEAGVFKIKAMTEGIEILGLRSGERASGGANADTGVFFIGQVAEFEIDKDWIGDNAEVMAVTKDGTEHTQVFGKIELDKAYVVTVSEKDGEIIFEW